MKKIIERPKGIPIFSISKVHNGASIKTQTVRFSIPKPIGTENHPSIIEGPEKEEQATTNNSPPSNWDIKRHGMKHEVIESLKSQSDDCLAVDVKAFSFSHESDGSAGKLAVNDFRDVKRNFFNEEDTVNRRRKYKKKRLVNLKQLHNLLVKIFLKHHVEIYDVPLQDFELHMLAEILIRKNRNSSLSR